MKNLAYIREALSIFRMEGNPEGLESPAETLRFNRRIGGDIVEFRRESIPSWHN